MALGALRKRARAPKKAAEGPTPAESPATVTFRDQQAANLVVALACTTLLTKAKPFVKALMDVYRPGRR